MSQWIQIATFIITLLSLACTLAFWFGVFRQFKKETEKKLDRIESIFFPRSLADLVPPPQRETSNQQPLARSTS